MIEGRSNINLSVTITDNDGNEKDLAGLSGFWNNLKYEEVLFVQKHLVEGITGALKAMNEESTQIVAEMQKGKQPKKP